MKIIQILNIPPSESESAGLIALTDTGQIFVGEAAGYEQEGNLVLYKWRSVDLPEECYE